MKMLIKENHEKTFPYVAHIPERISDHPALLIQLHGLGERGNGGADLDKVLDFAFARIVNDYNLKDCIIVTPQCPSDTFWVAKIESIKSFIDEIIYKFAVDTNRIYLCGVSMGGYGTWYTAMAYPNLFAAIVPCCGGGIGAYAWALKDMPIWAFHGMDDTIVSPNQTIEMVEALKDENPHLKYDLLEGVDHDLSSKAITEQTLAWILSQKLAR